MFGGWEKFENIFVVLFLNCFLINLCDEVLLNFYNIENLN